MGRGKQLGESAPLLKTAQRLQDSADEFLEKGDFKSAQDKYSAALQTVAGLEDDEALNIRFSCNINLAQAANARKKLSKSAGRKSPLREDTGPLQLGRQIGTQLSGREETLVGPPQPNTLDETRRGSSQAASRVTTARSAASFSQAQAGAFPITPYKSKSLPATPMSNVSLPIQEASQPKPAEEATFVTTKIHREKLQRARAEEIATPSPKTAMQLKRTAPTKSWGPARTGQPMRGCQMQEDYVTQQLRVDDERKRREQEARQRAEQDKAAALANLPDSEPTPVAPPTNQSFRSVMLRAGRSPGALKMRLPSYRQRQNVTLPLIPARMHLPIGSSVYTTQQLRGA